MNFKPLGNLVLIRLTKAEEKTKSGILIPDSAKKKPDEGVVFETGPDVSSNIQVGDKVLFGKYVGTYLSLEGHENEEFLLLNETDIFGIFEKEEE